MTPKEKAKELIEKFYQCQIKELAKENTTPIEAVEHAIAKQSALIAVDEVIKVCPYISKEDCDTVEQMRADDSLFMSHWQEVKTEINNL